jgi:4-diphosphocytidyl-2-C-methyl-D-erythritol kinase
MILHSFAKINLALIVKNRRPDGFHNIETIFTSVNLKDTLSLRRCDRIIVETDNPEIPSGPGNLAYQAASLVQKAFGVRQGVRIFIKKKIPIGAGLAGGSGNAAAVVKGLLKFWRKKPDKTRIDRILRLAGSDVPYCYYGGTMLGRGRGEKLVPLPVFKGYTVVLVCPGVPVSTAWAYKNLKRNLTYKEDKVKLYHNYREFLAGRRPLQGLLRNDFEKPVFREFPRIRKIRFDFTRLKAEGSLMSGSGSTVMGFFKNRALAAAAAGRFRKAGFLVHVAGLLVN